MSERKKLLAVATPEEWWAWADGKKFPLGCLLCLAYTHCWDCKIAGGHNPPFSGCYPQCGPQTIEQQLEAKAARLIRAGSERPEEKE